MITQGYIMNFYDLGLSEKMVEILQQNNFISPTKVQELAIPEIFKGYDIVCRSETGSGKTLSFALPIIQNIDTQNENIQALIVCPTRELAIQVAEETKNIATPVNVKVCAVFGGSTIARQIDSLKKKPHIVVGTTGRIRDLIDKKALKIENVDFVVFDEADEMLDMGFLPDIEEILSHTKKDRKTYLFSATMPREVKLLAQKYQNNAKLIEIGDENKALDNIKQRYVYVNKKCKKEVLKELFFSDVYGKTIVFVNTKQFADDIANFLNKNKITCKSIHSDLRQNDRKRVLESFRQGKIEVLVATDVASRGLDIRDVKWIINFDLPHELEYYVHRIGRTARAGDSGNAINIIASLEQLSYMRDIEKQTKAKITLFETKSENLKQYFIDTKKLAQSNNRFTRKRFDTMYQEYYNYDFEIDENTRKIKKNKDTKRNNVSKSNKSENVFLRSNKKDNRRTKNNKTENKHFSKTNKFDNNKSSKTNGKKTNAKKQKDKRDIVSKNKWYSKFEKR